MAKTGTRVVSFIMAAVFLASSLAVSLGVILLIRQDNKQKQAEEQQLQATQKAASPTSNTATNNGGTKLQGTPLPEFTPTTTGATQTSAIDLKVGDGDTVDENTEVTVHYTGAVASTGTIFQSSKDNGKPFTTKLDQVIKGWKDGILGMKVGGTRRITIPAADAYGPNPPQGSGIPANSDLIFDIDLLSVKK